MKCKVHPDKNAIAICSVCNKPVCAQCAVPENDGTFICDSCLTTKTLQQMVERRQEKLESKEVKKDERTSQKKKQARIRALVILAIAGVLVGVELLMYFRISVPEVNRFVPEQNPVVTPIVVDQAIEAYSWENEGRVPPNLGELVGKYLAPEVIGDEDLKKFSYTQKSPYSYELKQNIVAEDFVPEIIFTEEGVQLGGGF